MFKTRRLGLAVMIIGLFATLPISLNQFGTEQPAKAATITYKGKHYHSKYTVRQMRKRYHLKYRKKTLKISSNVYNHIVWNRYAGIVKNPTIRRERKMPMFIKIHGTYAAFFSAYVEANFNNKTAFINLKTGKKVMSHSGW
ncbi:hypothetical protein [Levilactobacillus namurensis]|uniref:Extracellular protein n=1 Tax=Levilactobacillus namurensis TaxID=380393 RepID=A0AAW8W4T5_9LACO|nr:hypothetical protein [Levilactobacillus namurensis]MDT7013266.1 hypothetical protein [Levilactobacillus namurensis]